MYFPPRHNEQPGGRSADIDTVSANVLLLRHNEQPGRSADRHRFCECLFLRMHFLLRHNQQPGRSADTDIDTVSVNVLFMVV